MCRDARGAQSMAIPGPSRRAVRRASSQRYEALRIPDVGGLLGLVPVDVRGARTRVEDLGPARLGEVVPAPVDERLDAVADAAHQRRVHAQPRGEGDRAVQLVPVLADLGPRRAAADHRHQALVLVMERDTRLAGPLAQDVLADALAALQGDRAQLRERAAVRPRDVGDVPHGIDAVDALDRQVGADVDAPAATGRQAAGRRDRRRLQPAAPPAGGGRPPTPPPRPVGRPLAAAIDAAFSPPPQTTQRVATVDPSDSTTWSAATSETPVPSRICTPRSLSTLAAYACAFSE